MKKNNKGFTLVELLAVLVILLAISVIAITSISAAIERNKKRQNDMKIETIKSSALAYYSAHKNSLFTNGNVFNIELSSLDLSEDDLKDADGNIIQGYVKITYNNVTKDVTLDFVNLASNDAIVPDYGDVDLSGEIDAGDASFILQYLAGTRELNNQQLANADVNGNGEIEVKDACLILKYTVNLADGGHDDLIVCTSGNCNLNTCIRNSLDYGDADLDSYITAGDATYILQYIKGMRELNDLQKLNADVDRNDVIEVKDACLILNYTVNLATGGYDTSIKCESEDCLDSLDDCIQEKQK